MTDFKQAMLQALDALDSDNPDIHLRAAVTLRAALAARDALLSVLQEIVEDQEKFRICCGESLWKAHDSDCWVPKARAAIDAARSDK